MSDDDRDLRNAFARLRESEMRSVPAFAVHDRQRTHVRRLAFAAALLLVVVVAGGYVARRALQRQPSSSPANVTLSTWRAPTDFLLRTPGRELVESTPRLESQPPVIHTTGGRS